MMDKAIEEKLSNLAIKADEDELFIDTGAEIIKVTASECMGFANLEYEILTKPKESGE